MKEMLQSCAKISSVLPDGDLPQGKMGFEVLLRGASPPSVLLPKLLWCDLMQRAACMGKGINQEVSAQEYRTGDVLKHTKAQKGCWTLRMNALCKSMFICFKKLLGLNR